jgi:serine/threonine protein kinase/WD40 repeat protein
VGDAVHDSVTNGEPVDAALAEYLLRRERGESVDVSQLIAAYPGCEDELRKFIAQERNVNRVLANGSPAAAPSHDMAGRVLGDFRLRKIIGRGGMGIVWEADQLSLHRKVAVKLLPGAMCSDPRHRTRFQNEARILAQLEHLNIVNVIAVGEEADTYYFAMQYIDGITAEALIRLWEENPRLGETRPHVAESLRDSDDNHNAPSPSPSPELGGEQNKSKESGEDSENGRLPQWAVRADKRERYRLCARIARDIACGLAHAHACGVLHRDVKPSNILLDKVGTARLTDFGLARMYGDATLTATGAILGTLRYASPEQLSGTHHIVDERSDVYSLGASLWEMVTCKRLFASEDRNSVITQVLKIDAPRPSSNSSGLPRDLETIITRAMAKEPADRYVSAQALADDLERFLDGRPIQAKPISLGERAFRWANRNRALTTASVGSLVALAIVAMAASGLVLRANSRTATALQESLANETKAKQSAVAAESSERKTRDLLYAADMALAGAALHKHQPDQVRSILDRYATQKPLEDGTTEEDLRGFEWHFLDRQVRPRSELLFQNNKALYLLELMPSGKEFFTAGQDSVVRWHDVKTGRVVHSLDTHQKEINCVSYNPAGTLFATAGEDGTVKLWNATDLSLLQTIKPHNRLCYFAKFVDDQRVFTGGECASQQIFDALSGRLTWEHVTTDATSPNVTSPNSTEAHVSGSTDRVWVCVGSGNYRYEGVYELDIANGTSRKISQDLKTRSVVPDRSERILFVASSTEGYVRILDAKSGEELWSTQLDFGLTALALSQDERQLAVGDRTGQVFLWRLDLSNPKAIVTSEAPRKLSIHNRSVYRIVFTSSGDSLLTASSDGTVRRTALQAPAGIFRELPWLSDKGGFATVPRTDLIVTQTPLAVYDRLTGKLIRTFSPNAYQAIAVSRDGTLAAASSPKHLGVWNIATGKRILSVDQQRRSVRGLDFSLDNSLLAATSNDGATNRVDVVEIATGKSTRYTPPEHSAERAYFCWEDGLVVKYSTPSYQLMCWSIPDRTVRWQKRLTSARIHDWALSPDRTMLLANVRTRDLRLIDCATGDVRYQAPDDYNPGPFAFLGDGRSFVVSNLRGGQLSLWHTGSGRRLFEIANLGARIDSIQPTDNGFLAATRRVKDGRTERVWLEF